MGCLPPFFLVQDFATIHSMFLFIAVVSWFCLMTIASFGPHDAEDIDKDFFFEKDKEKIFLVQRLPSALA